MTKTTTLFNQREKGKSTLLHFAVSSKADRDISANKEQSNCDNTESNTSKKEK